MHVMKWNVSQFEVIWAYTCYNTVTVIVNLFHVPFAIFKNDANNLYNLFFVCKKHKPANIGAKQQIML